MSSIPFMGFRTIFLPQASLVSKASEFMPQLQLLTQSIDGCETRRRLDCSSTPSARLIRNPFSGATSVVAKAVSFGPVSI